MLRTLQRFWRGRSWEGEGEGEEEGEEEEEEEVEPARASGEESPEPEHKGACGSIVSSRLGVPSCFPPSSTTNTTQTLTHANTLPSWGLDECGSTSSFASQRCSWDTKKSQARRSAAAAARGAWGGALRVR